MIILHAICKRKFISVPIKLKNKNKKLTAGHTQQREYSVEIEEEERNSRVYTVWKWKRKKGIHLFGREETDLKQRREAWTATPSGFSFGTPW